MKNTKSRIDGKVILITGGTGSFGNAMVRHLLSDYAPKTLRILSRDELKQYEMNRRFNDDRLRFFLGDVRDRQRLARACEGVDLIFHAAALKQVPACEYNPFEAVQTNILGGVNIVDAAIDCGVERVIAISTDKAVNPVNLYGATKLCAEKIFIHGNSYSGRRQTKFSCVRYGNVIGSRGSVLPLFLEQRAKGVLTITDPRMTRFWLSLDEAVRFVLDSLEEMVGGEIFVPQIPSMKILDLAEAVAPGAEIKVIGIRPGEKIHETLLMQEESRHTLRQKNGFIVLPEWFPSKVSRPYTGETLPNDFSYTSENNDQWLTPEQMRTYI